jgi:protein TonB
MSHELFHDVTDRRPRGSRATGGTLAASIVAHALILAAAIVVPLMATDALPTPGEAIGAFRIDAPPPPEPPAPPIERTHPVDTVPVRNVAPVEAPEKIVDEIARPPVADYTIGVEHSIGNGTGLGLIGGTNLESPAPPPPPPPPRPVRLSAYEMPRKVFDVAPRYPQIAQRAGIEGVVIIEAEISVDGSVRNARVLKSVALLDQAALDAVKQWRYAPTRLNGVAVPVIVTVTVQFHLQR